MNDTKRIMVRGAPIASGRHPLVCTPLVGGSVDDILREVAAVLPKRPDVVEWRADYFGQIADREAVIDTALRIRDAVGGIPVIFTCRSAREGGQRIALAASGVAELLGDVCGARAADLVDFELANAAGDVERVRDAARQNGVTLILSHHDFAATPGAEALLDTFRAAERAGGDVAKVAVMPRTLEDVLTLLSATLAARAALSIPLLSMSMGPLGSITRMVGWAFGSTLTFAVGQSSSAPGQIPIEDLRTALAIAQRAFGAER
jgi:3-dehydroquinate dehydratase I